MEILIKRTEYGSPDGISVFRYTRGERYEVDTRMMSRDLARSFLQMEVAEIVQDPSSASENKDDAGMVAAKTRKKVHSDPS